MKGFSFNMSKAMWKIIIPVTLLASLTGMVFCNDGAHADSSRVNIQERIRDKAIYQGVVKCYEDGAILQSVNASSYENISSILSDGASRIEIPFVSGSAGSLFSSRLDDYNLIDDVLRCSELFAGNSDRASSILSVSGKRNPSSPGDKKEFLEGMGYVFSGSGGDDNLRCYSVNYTRTSESGGEQPYSTNILCQNKESGKLSTRGSRGSFGYFSVDDDGKLCFHGSPTRWCDGFDNELSPSSLHRFFVSICGSDDLCQESDLDGGLYKWKFDSDSNNYPEAPVESDGGTLREPFSSAGLWAANYLSGNDYTSETIKVDRAETRILYQEYLNSFYGVDVDCEGDLDYGFGTVWWFNGSEMKECFIKNAGNGDTDHHVNGIGGTGGFDRVIRNKDELLDILNSDHEYTPDELSEMGAVAAGSRADQERGGVLEDCRSMGAGRSLGWILCPILELMGDGAEGMYQNMVVPMLEIKSYLFNGQDTAVYRAWSTFRDMANVMFVIVLLVVIFSQVTGIGIDNYGIKRILPKLIVCIVLINMSYLICAILIDLSNILGNGLRLMFDNLGSELNVDTIMIDQPAQAYPSGASAGSGFAATAIEGMVGVGLLVGFAKMAGPIWALGFGPMILISLLFGALGVLISIAFTFFLLGARQSAIVVLVTISPVIVLFSALPNTKSVYSRFVKMFQLLLFVYPIMGLLSGGGNYVSKLLLLAAPGEFYMALTAMVVGIVPIFFLPSLLKEAIAAVPRIGQMLSGFGDKARSNVSRFGNNLMNSESMKDANKIWKYNASKGAMKRLVGREKPLSNKQMSNLLKYAGTVQSYEDEMRKARLVTAKEKYAKKTNNELESDFRTAFVQGDADSVETLANLMYSRVGGSSTAGFISNLLYNVGDRQSDVNAQFMNNSRMQTSVQALRDTLDNNGNLSRDMRNKASDAFNMISNNGRDNYGNIHNLEYFANNNPISDVAKAPDWTSQKDTTIARALLGNSDLGESDEERKEWAEGLINANNAQNSSTFNTLSDSSKKLLTGYIDTVTRGEDTKEYLENYLDRKSGNLDVSGDRDKARKNLAEMAKRFEPGPRKSGPEPPRPPLS